MSDSRIRSGVPSYFGPLMMVFASLLFSTGGLLCKLIPWSALALNGLRNVLGGCLIGAYLLVTRHRLRFNGTILLGAVCMFGVTTGFAMANKLTTAANAIVLQYSAPVWVILLLALFFRKRPTRLEILTVIVVLAGVVCFFVDSLSAGNLAGNLIALLSGLFYAGVFLLNSFEKGDALSSLFFGQFFGGLILMPFVFQETDFTLPTVGAVVAMGLFQVGLAYIFFNYGTKYTGPVTASLITGIEPVLNPLLVAVFYKETVTPLSLVGAAIVVIAILLYNVKRSKSEA